MDNIVERPWGTFYVLDDQLHTKVKRLVVNPGHRLSLQSHDHRDEHWVVVQGTAEVTINDQTKILKYGQYAFVPCGAKHRIKCLSDVPVEIIEVQTGESFPEEDIVRYADDYNRI